MRDLLEKNFKAVVTQIAEMGYVGLSRWLSNISVLEAPIYSPIWACKVVRILNCPTVSKTR